MDMDVLEKAFAVKTAFLVSTTTAAVEESKQPLKAKLNEIFA